jgi:hypothetical protein
LSEGEYVSLGLNEADDLNTVVSYLREFEGVPGFGVWGRSMGASTALIHANKENTISALALDSPFADLTQLCEHHAKDLTRLPSLFTSYLIDMLRKTILKQSGVDIGKVKPIESAPKLKIPAYFFTAKSDDVVPLAQT